MALLLLLLLMVPLIAAQQSMCPNAAIAAQYGQPCGNPGLSTNCFPGGAVIPCSGFGQCLEPTVPLPWTCAHCVGVGQSGAHCVPAGVVSSEPVTQQQYEITQSLLFGYVLQYNSEFSSPAAPLIARPSTTSVAMRNTSVKASPLVAFLSDDSTMTIGLTTSAFGQSELGTQYIASTNYYVAPLPLTLGATNAEQLSFFTGDGGVNWTQLVLNVSSVNTPYMQDTAQATYPPSTNAATTGVAIRSVRYRLWPRFVGPPDDVTGIYGGQPFLPPAVSMPLPPFNNALATAWNPSAPQIFPRLVMANAGPSSAAPITVLNPAHNVWAAGASTHSLTQVQPSVDAADAPVPVLAPAPTIDITALPPADETLHPSYAIGQAVERVAVISNVAKLYYLQNRSVRFVPIMDPSGVPSDPVAVATLAPIVTYEHVVETYDGLTSAVFVPRTLTVHFVGPNTFGQFGVGAAAVGQTMHGEAFQLILATGQETIVELKLGEQHMILRSSESILYFSGQTSQSQAACYVQGDAHSDQTTLSQMAFNANVTAMSAGAFHSTFIVYPGTGPVSLIGCGGSGYMTTVNPTGTQYTYQLAFMEAERQFTDVCSGGYFSCLRSTSGLAACWGTQERVVDGTDTGTLLTMPLICSPRVGASAAFDNGKEALIFNGVESVSCGTDHVALTILEVAAGQELPPPVFAALTAANTTVRDVITCGSNLYGQLGFNLQYTSTLTVQQAPLFTVPEVVVTAQGSQGVGLFAGIADTTQQNLVPLYQVTAAQALANNTVVMTRQRTYDTPNDLQTAYRLATGQYPPTSTYQFTPSVFGSGASWLVNYRLVQGLPLILVSNQTTGNRFLTPASNPLAFPSSSSPDLTNKTSGAYFLNYNALNTSTRTDTWFPHDDIFHRVEHAVVFHHFFVTSEGAILHAEDETQIRLCPKLPAHEVAYCTVPSNATTQQRWMIWAAPNVPAPPAGYSDIFGGDANVTWVALYVYLDWLDFEGNVTVPLPTPIPTQHATPAPPGTPPTPAPTKTPPAPNVTNPLLYTTWPAYAAYEADVMYHATSLVCRYATSVVDCSTVTWFEGYSAQYPPSISSLGTFSWPMGGVLGSVQRVTASVGSVTLQPVTYTAAAISSNSVPNGYSSQNMGFENVCVFAKIGPKWYYLQLLSTGTVVICSQMSEVTVRHTKTKTLHSPAGPQPPSPVPSWYFIAPGLLHLTNVELYDPTRYAPESFNVSSVTFQLSCSGGVRVLLNPATNAVASRDTSSFILLTNESLIDAFAQYPQWFNDPFATTTVLQQFRAAGASGCDAGYVVYPPSTTAFSEFHTYIRATSAIASSGDAAIIELVSPGLNAVTGVRYRIQVDGNGVQVFDVTQGTGTNKIQSALPAFTCIERPFPVNAFTHFALYYDEYTNVTSIEWNGEAACSGDLLTYEASRALSAVYIGVLSKNAAPTSAITFREIVVCDGTQATASVVGCSIGGKPYPVTLATHTRSRPVTATITEHLTASHSETETITHFPTPTFTESYSSTHSVTLLETPTDTHVASSTESASSSESLTRSFTDRSPSETFSHIPNFQLFLDGYDESTVTSTLLRRTGIVFRLVLQGDYFNPYADWAGSAAGLLWVNCSVSVEQNPSGFLGSFNDAGFISAVIDAQNFSMLDVSIGPFGPYNSAEDQTVTMSLKPMGAASHLQVPNSVQFFIPGSGQFVSGPMSDLESGAAALTLAAVVMMAPSSLVLHFAQNTQLLNFQCFNLEQYRATYLYNPMTLQFTSNEDLDVSVGNFVVILAIWGAHLMAVWAYKASQFRRTNVHVTWVKVQGKLFFPSLSMVVSVFFVPGLMMGSWRAGVRASSVLSVLYPVLVTCVVVTPLVYLTSVLYDNSNFCAAWMPLDPEMIRIRRLTSRVFRHFQPHGWWRSTDRQLTFHRRLYYVFHEYTERRRYFFTLHLFALLFEAVIFSFTNSSVLICSAQLFCAALLRAGVLVSELVFRPHNSNAGHWLGIVVGAVNFVVAVVFACWAAQSLTNTFQELTQIALYMSTGTLAAAALIFTIPFARQRYLEYQHYRRLMSIPGRLDDRLLEEGLHESLSWRPLGEERNFETGAEAKRHHASPDEMAGSNSGDSAAEDDLDRSGPPPAASAASPPPLSGATNHIAAPAAAAAKKVRRKKKSSGAATAQRGPTVFDLIAQEEANDRPVDLSARLRGLVNADGDLL